MRSSILAVALSAAALTACGGGGGSSPISVPTTTSPAPITTKTVVFVIAGKGQSTRPSWSLRQILSTSVQQEPVEIGSTLCDPNSPTYSNCAGGEFANNTGNRASILPKVVDAAGSPVPEAAPPTVTVSDTTVATAVSSPTPSPSPGATAAPAYIRITATRATTGATSATVTFPDASGSVPVLVYQSFGLQVTQAPDSLGMMGVSVDAAGALVPQQDPATSDLSMTGPGGIDKFRTTEAGPTFHAPLGLVEIPPTTPISSILDCSLMFAAGAPVTSLTTSKAQADFFTTGGTYLVKGASGGCIKWRLIGVGLTVVTGNALGSKPGQPFPM